MGNFSSLQADLGVCGGKVYDRSDLVVLSILDPRLFAAGTWIASDTNRPANPGDLCYFGYWEHRRRLDFPEYDQGGIFWECTGGKGDAFLGFGGFAPCTPFSDLGAVAPPPR